MHGDMFLEVPGFHTATSALPAGHSDQCKKFSYRCLLLIIGKFLDLPIYFNCPDEIPAFSVSVSSWIIASASIYSINLQIPPDVCQLSVSRLPVSGMKRTFYLPAHGHYIHISTIHQKPAQMHIVQHNQGRKKGRSARNNP